MKDVYRLFTSKVATGRKLDLEKVATLAEGRVFTGRMAKEAGLVDQLGTLEDAVDEAKKLAGIEDEEEVERLLLPEPRGLFDDLFGMQGAVQPVAEAALLARFGHLPGFQILAGHVEALTLLSSGRPLLLLPARVKIH